MMEYFNYLLVFILLLLTAAVVYVIYAINTARRAGWKRRGTGSSMVVAGDILLGKNFTGHSPIVTLSFDEALQVDTFLSGLRNFGIHSADAACREIFKTEPRPRGLLPAPPIIQDVKIPGPPNNPLDTGKIIWELTREGKRLFKQAKIEWLKNRKTGKFMPGLSGRRSKKFKDILGLYSTEDIIKISKLVNMAVVNAAHLISGADQARELKLMRGKLDYLADARKIDRLSKLESNFYLAKELLANTADDITKSKILDLHREIVEMRTVWRSEIEYKLKNIEDPQAKSFFDKLFTSRRAMDRQVHSEISQFEEEIALIDFTLIYDIALCASIGHINTGLAAEIARLEKTRDLLVEKAAYISGANDEYNIDSQLEQLDKILRRYRNFLYKY